MALDLNQVIVGEWYRPTKKHTEECCGCGLKHDLEYKVVDGELWIRVLKVRKKRGARAAR